jgi:SAM-dependent methyltransferase
MTQFTAWENEYQEPKLLTKKPGPQNDTLRFFRFLKKEEHFEIKNLRILDLGSGTGRNSNYLANLDNAVFGLEISDTAINLAKERAQEMDIKKNVEYLRQSIGTKYPFDDQYFDMALDVVSSNSLTESEREIYLNEVCRTLKTGGYLFVRNMTLTI